MRQKSFYILTNLSPILNGCHPLRPLTSRLKRAWVEFMCLASIKSRSWYGHLVVDISHPISHTNNCVHSNVLFLCYMHVHQKFMNFKMAHFPCAAIFNNSWWCDMVFLSLCKRSLCQNNTVTVTRYNFEDGGDSKIHFFLWYKHYSSGLFSVFFRRSQGSLEHTLGPKTDFTPHSCSLSGFHNDGKWLSPTIYDLCSYFHLMLSSSRYRGKRWHCIIIHNHKFTDGVHESLYYRRILTVPATRCMNLVCVFSFHAFIFLWHSSTVRFMCRVDVFVRTGSFLLVSIIHVRYFIILELVFYKFHFVIPLHRSGNV